jgi:O-antigen/teichoic acid export membrane protein
MTSTITTRQLGRNLGYSAISAASASLLLVLSILITNVLGQAEWGKFSVALSLAMIGEALMDFGIHQVTIRTIARDRAQAPGLFRNSIALKSVSAAVMFVVLGGIAWYWQREADVRAACLIMLAAAILRSYLLTIRGVLQGLERFGDDSVVVIADRGIVLVCGALALQLHYKVVGLAWSFVLGRALAVAAALLIARRHVGLPKPEFDKALWRDLQRRALPLGAFLIVLNLYSYVDTIILFALTGSAIETGLYNSAYRTYEGLTYATAILSAVITPRLASLWKDDRAGHLRLLRGSLAVSGLAAVALTIATWLAAPLVLSIFGAEAVAATTAVRILAVGLVFVFTIWVLHAAAISVFEERWLLRATLIGLTLNVALNLYLIPDYGRNGAAAATVLSELLSMVILVWALRFAIWPRASA